MKLLGSSKLIYFIIVVISMIFTYILVSTTLDEDSALTITLLIIPLGVIYAITFMTRNTVMSPDLFAKTILGEFQREDSTILDHILSRTNQNKNILLFCGGRSFFLWWENFIKVSMKPVSWEIEVLNIDCNKIAYKAIIKCSGIIVREYFMRFIGMCGKIEKNEISETNFNAVKVEFAKTLEQLLRNKMEDKNAPYANATPDDIQKLSGDFLTGLISDLQKLEDDSDSSTVAKCKIPGFLVMEMIGMIVGRFSLDISAMDPAIRLAGELPYKASMESQASEKNKETLKNIGQGLADAVKPIVDVLSGGKTDSAPQIANSAVTLLRTGLPGSKIDQSIIDLNDNSGKAGINVRGGK